MNLKNTILTSIFVGLMFFFIGMFGQLITEKTALVMEEKSVAPVIVLDPGHGGFDGGATSKDGTAEKDINLQIALKLKEIMENYDVEVVMTRETDTSLNNDENEGASAKTDDMKRRKEIIDEAKAVLTVSIHLNSYPSDESVYGAQVFYPSCEQKRTIMKNYEQTSRIYAESVQKSLEINIEDGRERGTLQKNDIYLFRNITCPIILIECGFLSNAVECERLKTAEYQAVLAEAIWEGINTNLKAEKKQKIQVIHSANKKAKNLL